MLASDLRLMCVLAHPDDESLGTGGALAKYAAEGQRRERRAGAGIRLVRGIAMTISPELEALRTRRAALEIEADEFRAIGHRLVDEIADGLSRVPGGLVTPDESPAQLRATIRAEQGLPSTGADAAALVSDATKLLFGHSTFNGHPRFFGYITSSPSPIGMFGDFLAAALNQNVGAWRLAPLATEIEGQSVRWIAELVGYPTDCGGLLVSGGNLANFVCFVAARAARAGWDVRKEGLAHGGASLLVYASVETHTWIYKAVDLFGLGTDAIRLISTDDEQRMDSSALRQAIQQDVKAGHRPFLVVATAGTVSTGAVDPLPEIAAVCREHDLWFHVDGAYGALAARVPGAPSSLRALHMADSVAVDPHKWLYAPLEAGCVLVRDAERLRGAFSYHPPYYHFDSDAVNYFDYGPQNSRGFRALKVWLALKQVGSDGCLTMIGDDILLARHLHQIVSDHPDFEAVTRNLSIATFRYVPRDLRPRLGTSSVEEYLDVLNRNLLTALEKSGQAFLSNAVVGGKFLLRACVVNFHTALGDIEAVPPLLCRFGAEADRVLRRERNPG
ncbi:MAG: aromatic-L-amino-acid/L-tryptophan decarboxylase [Acidobacteriota bacterium]|jgi:glutamate/tyrosine decarboxylase-like PLP-dependent enzyme